MSKKTCTIGIIISIICTTIFIYVFKKCGDMVIYGEIAEKEGMILEKYKEWVSDNDNPGGGHTEIFYKTRIDNEICDVYSAYLGHEEEYNYGDIVTVYEYNEKFYLSKDRLLSRENENPMTLFSLMGVCFSICIVVFFVIQYNITVRNTKKEDNRNE